MQSPGQVPGETEKLLLSLRPGAVNRLMHKNTTATRPLYQALNDVMLHHKYR